MQSAYLVFKDENPRPVPLTAASVLPRRFHAHGVAPRLPMDRPVCGGRPALGGLVGRRLVDLRSHLLSPARFMRGTTYVDRPADKPSSTQAWSLAKRGSRRISRMGLIENIVISRGTAIPQD